MPPLRLTSLLQTALPNLSKPGRAVVNALACLNGHITSATEVATWVGLRDRHQLSRLLRRDGLPSLERLAGWTRVLYWISEAEASGASLLQLARRDHTNAAVAYRLVRRVTGTCWSEVRRAGLAAAVLRLHDRGRPRPAAARATAARPLGSVVQTTPRRSWPLTSTPPAPEPRRHPDGILGDRVAVHGHPFDVAISPSGVALVTCPHAATLDVVGLHPLRHCGSIPTGSVPTRVQISRNGDWAYVTSQFAEEVEIIDLRAGIQAGAIPINGHPLGAALAPDGRILYVTSNTDRLHAVSLGSKRVIASVPIPMGSPQITLHPVGHRVYVSGWKAGTVTECDASSLRVIRTFQTGGITQDIVVSTAGTLYAANQSGWVDVFALATGRRTSKVDMGAAAFGLGLSRDESVLIVSLLFSGVVCVLDAKLLTIRSKLHPGGTPRLMAFDHSGRTGLMANEAGWVDKIV